MAADRKRSRDGINSADLAMTASELRASLLHHSDAKAAPAAWRDIIAAAGGADSFLCHIGRSIADSIHKVAVSSEESRAELRSVRAALHSAVDSRCDELEARIHSAESTKIAALERDLCTVDTALELWRAEQRAAAEAAASLDNTDLVARQAELLSRMEAAEAQLLAISTCVLEPSCVRLAADVSSLLVKLDVFGCIIAPHAVTAADFALGFIPTPRSDRALLCLTLQTPQHTSQSVKELEISLVAAAAATSIVASMRFPGDELHPLLVHSIDVDATSRRILLSFNVPPDISSAAVICIDSATVAGQPVAGVPRPSSIPFRRCVRAPLRLKWDYTYEDPLSLVIFPDGRLYVPQETSPDVLVFDSDGIALPNIPVASLGLTRGTCFVAYADDSSPSLLFADYYGPLTPRLVAVDAATYSVRWATPPVLYELCHGLTVLPLSGIAVIASKGELFAHRLSNGESVGNVKVRGLRLGLTADTSSGIMFANMRIGNGDDADQLVDASGDDDHDDDDESGGDLFAISRISWVDGLGFMAEGIVTAIEEFGDIRPLAVVPPFFGKRVSFFVVCTVDTLCVYALPGLSFVHTHKLTGMVVTALAADPSGTALAVCDNESKSIHVLAWPLPGMAAME